LDLVSIKAQEFSKIYILKYLYCTFEFCLTVHHQLGKVIQMNQLDAAMIH